MRAHAWALWFSVVLSSCGPTNDGPDDHFGDPDGAPPPPPITDTDGDRISDHDEGAATAVDTDHDGRPDYLDDDSDGDGLLDAVEAGDERADSAPVDSDVDGTPDFRDLDSDGNRRDDATDGSGDTDGDGRLDFADVDDDGDGIRDLDELGPDPAAPVDTDGDHTADFRDADSDNDTVLDAAEGGADFDSDGVGNFRDLDADGDCRPDRLEAGGNPPRDTDGDGRFDFLDRDSDDDGLADRVEDPDCSGTRGGDETDATRADTDGDGVTDLIETEAGTDPNAAADNPQAHGDFVFVEPYQAPQTPRDDDLDFTTRLQNVDVYILVDRSGSMGDETSSIQRNLAGVIDRLQCPPMGSGSPSTCIADLWAGVGGIGYRAAQPFVHYRDIQPDPSAVTIPGVPGTGTTLETLTFGVWAAMTASGTAQATGCSFSSTVTERGSCSNSPAAAAGFTGYGYPCFREGALPVILLATDEPPLTANDTYVCPTWTTTQSALASRHGKVVGVYGSGTTDVTREDLRTMARDTGAVDAAHGNAPLVFDGADAGASTAIEDGIRALANGIPLDMVARPTDDSGDSVDAVAAFVDHLETLQGGSPSCASGLTDVDSNGDGFRDRFVGVRAGTPVCWKLASKPNTTVPATDRPQLFRATIDVYGDGITRLDSRRVFFLVPPRPIDEPVE